MVCDEIRKDDRISSMIQSVVEKLYLPTKGMYRHYPTGECREYDGHAIGSVQQEPVNGWILSTDIGCCFIALDALSEYYLRTGDTRVLPLLQEMADSFMEIDYVSASMQTHAALSATRGILRLYQATKDQRYSLFAKSFFEFYLQYGMTENYANYNWFARPTWTEPCAIVDSYLLAVELFRMTKDVKFVEVANRIFYNGFEAAQRSNGGFGCDRCVVPNGEQELLSTWKEYYEAYWCCSMRGAEGLCYAVQNAFLPSETGGAFVNYIPGDYTSEHMEYTVRTQFPYDGVVCVSFARCPENSTIQFWLPEHCDQNEVQIQVNGMPIPIVRTQLGVEVQVSGKTELKISLPLKSCIASSLHQTENKKRNCWYGILMLGCNAERDFSLDTFSKWDYNTTMSRAADEDLLYPLNQGIFLSQDEVLQRRTKILF